MCFLTCICMLCVYVHMCCKGKLYHLMRNNRELHDHRSWLFNIFTWKRFMSLIQNCMQKANKCPGKGFAFEQKC